MTAVSSGADAHPFRLLDRSAERAKVLQAFGSHSRILIAGPPEAEVSAFAEWVATECAPDSKCIWWDFDRTPGFEAVEILKEIANELPSADAFNTMLSTVEAEFNSAPQASINQEVGPYAEAGENQTFSAVVNLPNLADYIDRNLNRLAKALFLDIKSSGQNGRILLLISGIRAGCKDPVPCNRLMAVIRSTVWRLSENCSADELCVVLAATITRADDLETPGLYYSSALGLIGIEEAVDVFVDSIPGLLPAEAKSAVYTIAEPGTGGISYTALREGLARFELNRLELTLGGTADG